MKRRKGRLIPRDWLKFRGPQAAAPSNSYGRPTGKAGMSLQEDNGIVSGEAVRTHLIPVSERELAELLRAGCRLDLAFGTGGSALKWTDNEPMPEAVKRLGAMRGIANENMHGAGI